MESKLRFWAFFSPRSKKSSSFSSCCLLRWMKKKITPAIKATPAIDPTTAPAMVPLETPEPPLEALDDEDRLAVLDEVELLLECSAVPDVVDAALVSELEEALLSELELEVVAAPLLDDRLLSDRLASELEDDAVDDDDDEDVLEDEEVDEVVRVDDEDEDEEDDEAELEEAAIVEPLTSSLT